VVSVITQLVIKIDKYTFDEQNALIMRNT